MDLGAIQGIMASLKAATEVSKAIFDLKVAADVQSKVIDLQSALLAAQSSAMEAVNSQYALQERIRVLESQLKDMLDWEAQAPRYSLFCPWRGPAQVYALKKSEAGGEQPHYLCTNCFHNRKRVILNPTTKEGWVSLVCPACKSSIATGLRSIGAPKFADAAEGEA